MLENVEKDVCRARHGKATPEHGISTPRYT